MLILLIIVLIFVLFLALSKSSNSQKIIIQEPKIKSNYNPNRHSFPVKESFPTDVSRNIFLTYANALLRNTEYNLPLFEQYFFNTETLGKSDYEAKQKVILGIENFLYCDWEIPDELSEIIKIESISTDISEIVSIDSTSLIIDFDVEIEIGFADNIDDAIDAIKKYEQENQDLRLEVKMVFYPDKLSNKTYHFESFDSDFIHELIEANGPWYLN